MCLLANGVKARKVSPQRVTRWKPFFFVWFYLGAYSFGPSIMVLVPGGSLSFNASRICALST